MVKISIVSQISGCLFLIFILTSSNMHTHTSHFPMYTISPVMIINYFLYNFSFLYDFFLNHCSLEKILSLTAAALHNFSPWRGKAHQIHVIRYHAHLGMYVAMMTPQCTAGHFPYCFSAFLWVKQCNYPVLCSLLKNKEHKEFICTNSSCLEKKK